MTDVVRHLELVTPETQFTHFYESIPGFFWSAECLRRLLTTLPDDKPSRFVELGVFQGRSTAWLGVEILNSHKPVTLYCVDSFIGVSPDDPHGLPLMELFQTHTAPLRQAMGDRFQMWPLPSLEAAACFEDASLDVVFVDGDHSYEAVRADIAAWFPKVRPGGFMAGDDFMMTPVCRAVCEAFAPSNYILVHGWSDRVYRDGSGQPESMCWPSWIARKS